jgi:hypothetical protein
MPVIVSAAVMSMRSSPLPGEGNAVFLAFFQDFPYQYFLSYILIYAYIK